jgi:hypothetical protein
MAAMKSSAKTVSPDDGGRLYLGFGDGYVYGQ